MEIKRTKSLSSVRRLPPKSEVLQMLRSTTKSEVNNYKRLLKSIFDNLSAVHNVTPRLKLLMQQDFQNINEGEAYKVLRYLLISCGGRFGDDLKSLNYNLLLQSGQSSFRALHSDDKKQIQTMKLNIFGALNEFLKGSMSKMCLKKTDMVAPNCLKFFECSVYVGRAALKHQLQCSGVDIPNLEGLERSKIQRLTEELRAVQVKLEEVLERSLSNSKKQRADVSRALDFIRTLYSEAVILMNQELVGLPQEFSGESNNSEVVIQSMKNAAEELKVANIEKLARLKSLTEKLHDLELWLRGGMKRDEFEFDVSLLPPETLQGAQRYSVELLTARGELNLSGLVEVAGQSLAECAAQLPTIPPVAPLVSPQSHLDRAQALYRTAVIIKNKLRYWMVKNPFPISDLDRQAVQDWNTSFFIQIPALDLPSQEPFSNFRYPEVQVSIDMKKFDEALKEYSNSSKNNKISHKYPNIK